MANANEQFEVGVEALAGLLDEFRRGNIGDRRKEKQALERHLAELNKRWDRQFPGFP